MAGSYIRYPKYKIDITRYYDHTLLGVTSIYYKKIYLISKSTYENEFVQNLRRMSDLKNKNGMLYFGLFMAIDKFIEGESIYVVPKKISKKY